MRKNRIFALLLAACVTVCSMPVAVFASGEEEGEPIIADDLLEPTADDTLEPAVETPTPTETEAPKETDAPVPTETDTPVETETPTPTETEAPTETPAAQEVYIGNTGYDSLEAAVNAVAQSTGKTAEILLKSDQTVKTTITIPAGVSVTFTGEKGVTLTKEQSLKDAMFHVSGTLHLGKSGDSQPLTLKGSSGATAALLHVEGTLQVFPNVTISGNQSLGNGGAIYNTGKTILNGCTIKGNQSDKGGAVYNNGTLELSGAAVVTGNTKADGKTACNIYLAGKSAVTASSLASGAKIGVTAEQPKDGLTVLKAANGSSLKEQAKYFTYDAKDLYTINSNGQLEKATADDTTPPTLAEVFAERISDSEANITFTSDEKGTYYYRVDNAAVNTSKGGAALEENVDVVLKLTGLSAGAHTVYIVAIDDAGNQSETLEVDVPALEKEPMIANASDNKINGIQSSYDKTYRSSGSSVTKYLISFSAVGAGMDFPEEEGNIRYEPKSWGISSLTNQAFEEGYKASFSGTSAGTYVLSVDFEQQRYDGENWVATGEVDVKTADIVLNKSGSTTPSPTSKFSNTTKSGNTSQASSVSTGDESPIQSLIFLGIGAGALAVCLLFIKRKYQANK